MSDMKTIWHTTDITPEEDRVIVVKSKRTGEYLVGIEFEFILDNFTKWAYFDDLLALETELERTRKALDVALDWLEQVATLAKCDDDLAESLQNENLLKSKQHLTKGLKNEYAHTQTK